MFGATDTSSGPEVAPVGIVMLTDVALQLLMVTATSFSSTSLAPCEAPKPVPEISTWLPIEPVVAETLLITGAGAAAELTDTLSKAAVATAVGRLLTAKPMYTFCARVTVWLPNGTQFTPSLEPDIVNTFPLRTSLSQYGNAGMLAND